MVTAFATSEHVDAVMLYTNFLAHETDATGTVVMHHGQVKRPGKQIADFSTVDLKALTFDVNEKLGSLAENAKLQFELNQVLIVHRLGEIKARDTVLVVIVSGKTRHRCFNACSWIVDKIKQEEFISLVEQK
jgi:molybdopterin synthase catalytic subunit